MAHIRKNGWEKGWGIELKEGEKLASRLRRLEKLKAEIMELKQSVISEIRSYGNPPPAVSFHLYFKFVSQGGQTDTPTPHLTQKKKLKK